jgi:hypothetical protein
MLLPTKGLSAERALLTVGADILPLLSSPLSISELWDRYTSEVKKKGLLSFDWFTLSLTTLFTIGAIELTDDQKLSRANVSS